MLTALTSREVRRWSCYLRSRCRAEGVIRDTDTCGLVRTLHPLPVRDGCNARPGRRISPHECHLQSSQFWWLPRRDRTRPGSVRNPGLSSPSRGPHPEAGRWRGLANGRESVKRPERHLPGDVVGRGRGLPSVRQEVGARRDPRDLRERGLTRGNSRWTRTARPANTRPDADRAALIGQLHQRDDAEWLVEILIDLEEDEPARIGTADRVPHLSRRRPRNVAKRRAWSSSEAAGRDAFPQIAAARSVCPGNLAKVGVAGSNPVVRSR